MDQFTYFHLCDHRIKKTPRNGELTTLTVYNDGDQIQTVMNGGILLKLLEVRVLEYEVNDAEIVDFYYDNLDSEQNYDDADLGEAYYDDKEQYIVDYSKYFEIGEKVSEPLPEGFYEPFLHNRIRWLVKPPKKYQITAEIKYTNTSYITYSPFECPICVGKGWFIDLLNKEGQFLQPKGIVKIAQRVVKNLMTELGSQIFDPSYGTTVKKDAMRLSTNDDQLFDMIRMTISGVEDSYLNDQQNMITQLAEEDILLSLVTDDVFRMPQNPTIVIVRMRLRTAIEEQTFQLGF